MALILLVYLGGLLTIASPCILPVLPFVFARAGQPFARSVLPMLAGMAATFALVATLAAVGGGWAVTANQWGRNLALGLMALFGLALLLPRLAEAMARPLVAAGARLSLAAGDKPGPGSSALLGVATGLLWAPCAGPILGLVLTGAALSGTSTATTFLLLAYGAGAATALALALFAGGRVARAMKRSLSTGEWIRRTLGLAMLAGVAAIAAGLDTGLLARLSTASTQSVEQSLLARLGKERTAPAAPLAAEAPFAPLAAFDAATSWFNSRPLAAADLKGKVVLVDFWTYSCINCLRTLPYVKSWAETYRDRGLVVIGVHAPEFAFERDPANVEAAIRRFGISYPVVQDNDYALWRAFDNAYWPAHYFIDARGRIRHTQFGEGNHDISERMIQTLLAEAGADALPETLARPQGLGVEREAGSDGPRSPETYLGYERGERFRSGTVRPDAAKDYALPETLPENGWGLGGSWIVGAENSVSAAPGGRIAFSFLARDLHLVLGPAEGGKPVRFTVTLDGGAPGAAHGSDIAADGSGIVTEQRLYQLIRRTEADGWHLFTIEFEDPGAAAYAFTFG